MSVGDLIEGYSEDRDVLNTEWDEFIGFVEKLDMPFFYLPGNHDISNPVMAEVWKERFDRSYYHFVYRDVLFVCLNSEETAPNTITSQQADWVEGVLADNSDVRWTMVFLHKPLWNYNETGSEEMHAMWTRIEGMLVGRKHTVFFRAFPPIYQTRAQREQLFCAGHYRRWQWIERTPVRRVRSRRVGDDV
jgi:hypothetical protein